MSNAGDDSYIIEGNGGLTAGSGGRGGSYFRAGQDGERTWQVFIAKGRRAIRIGSYKAHNGYHPDRWLPGRRAVYM
ncbi:hypothetical protein DPMN_128172 [Dreissena polymorpha]|uniref:Uncharacterized protein n=1 Tax=Dreissena polymorpha TaxID=45954 RepID=A0A9D4H2I3_DREPO|nr:hypothetical protein DPMN_128172 [Dreissena polymorpha]